MAGRVMMTEINGGRVRSRQRLRWMDGMKVALGSSSDARGGCATIRGS